jgi:hypothetical protein
VAVLLTEAVTKALTDLEQPAAVLALQYAEAIDQATHVPLALADALAALARAAELADDAAESDDAGRAYRKVAAAVATATILERLGPKLLVTLDTLLVTPRARAALAHRLGAGAQPASPLDALRDRHGTRKLRAAG